MKKWHCWYLELTKNMLSPLASQKAQLTTMQLSFHNGTTNMNTAGSNATWLPPTKENWHQKYIFINGVHDKFYDSCFYLCIVISFSLFFFIYLYKVSLLDTLLLTICNLVSVQVFCQDKPNIKFPHIANCARYYDCSAIEADPIFGKYQRECTYPTLFNIDLLRCVPPAEADCQWRYEPKDPCK